MSSSDSAFSYSKCIRYISDRLIGCQLFEVIAIFTEPDSKKNGRRVENPWSERRHAFDGVISKQNGKDSITYFKRDLSYGFEDSTIGGRVVVCPKCYNSF